MVKSNFSSDNLHDKLYLVYLFLAWFEERKNKLDKKVDSPS